MFERRHRVFALAVDTERLPAGDEQSDVATRTHEGAELGSRVDDLLEVVEHEERVAVAQVPVQVVSGAERLGDRAGDERWIAHRPRAEST